MLNITTYIDGQNQPTHPSVIDMQSLWHGFRFWMAYSPYPNANGAEENPCICVSNDMLHWTTPAGLYNPIAFNEETACDELKDPHILYNNDLNQLEVWYLGRIDSTISNGGTLLLFRKTSLDGVHWSAYEVMRTLPGFTSPSIVYDDGKYKLWAIRPSSSKTQGGLAYAESVDGKSWSEFSDCSFGNSTVLTKIWHGAVSRQDKYRFVFIEDGAESDAVLYAESIDGRIWEGPKTIVQKGKFWHGFYRPCILYSDNMYYCIYGVITKDNKWYLSMSKGETIDTLSGISMQEVGESTINAALKATLSIKRKIKDTYHFVQSYCRPELLLLCCMVAAVVLPFARYSLVALWTISWLLCVLRFYANLKWLKCSEVLLLLLTMGAISLICSMAILYALTRLC